MSVIKLLQNPHIRSSLCPLMVYSYSQLKFKTFPRLYRKTRDPHRSKQRQMPTIYKVWFPARKSAQENYLSGVSTMFYQLEHRIESPPTYKYSCFSNHRVGCKWNAEKETSPTTWSPLKKCWSRPRLNSPENISSLVNAYTVS